MHDDHAHLRNLGGEAELLLVADSATTSAWGGALAVSEAGDLCL